MPPCSSPDFFSGNRVDQIWRRNVHAWVAIGPSTAPCCRYLLKEVGGHSGTVCGWLGRHVGAASVARPVCSGLWRSGCSGHELHRCRCMHDCGGPEVHCPAPLAVPLNPAAAIIGSRSDWKAGDPQIKCRVLFQREGRWNKGRVRPTRERGGQRAAADQAFSRSYPVSLFPRNLQTRPRTDIALQAPVPRWKPSGTARTSAGTLRG